MSVEVSVFDDDRETWNRYVEQSPHGSIFHRYPFLDVLEGNSAGTVHTLIGHKGNEPVGLFPLLALEKYGRKMAFSPPPRMGMPYQGPILLNHEKLKQRKRERRHERFISGCLEWCEREIDPSYTLLRTQTTYDDPRPFIWEEWEITPRYTYVLDISQELETVKRSFSKSLRRYLDPDDSDRFQIEVQGEDGIRFIHDQMTTRYEEQGKEYAVSLDLLLDLYLEHTEVNVKPYICLVDGERAGGIMALADADTVYFHEGGGAPDVDYPINDLLHWQIITDAHEEGRTEYDLAGANNQRLCSYKSKFNAELREYFELKKSTATMDAAMKVYQRYMM